MLKSKFKKIRKSTDSHRIEMLKVKIEKFTKKSENQQSVTTVLVRS